MKYERNDNVSLWLVKEISTLTDCQFYAPVVQYTKKSRTSYTDRSCASASIPKRNLAKGLSSSEISHFSNTPLDRFPRITVEIQAPVKDDPGQVILGRDSVWQIVSLILDFIKGRGQRPDHSNQVILPRIEKKLLDRSCEKWFDHVAEDWQRSIPAYLE